MDSVLLYFSLKYNGNWDSIYDALDKKEKIDSDDLSELVEKFSSQFITIINPLYPTNLKQSHKPPFVLFFNGSASLLSNYHQILACIGGNEFDERGENNKNSIIQKLLSENRILLTDDSKGLNLQIINLAIENKGRIIIVTKQRLSNFINDNIDLIKKLELIDYLIISETEFSELNTPVDFDSEEFKNRLIVGLSKAIVFFQSNQNDKFNKIVNHALNDGKDIFALPEPIDSKFRTTNQLIKQGAKLVESANDILNDL